MKLKFDIVHDFIDATGYDWGSFCVFVGITKPRMKEIAESGECSEAEWYKIAEGIEIHPQILVDASE